VSIYFQMVIYSIVIASVDISVYIQNIKTLFQCLCVLIYTNLF